MDISIDDLKALVPTDKCDAVSVDVLSAMEFREIEPILPELLTWLQDINWPVAQELFPVLAGLGVDLAPYLRDILSTDDYIWMHWILFLVAENHSLANELRQDLGRLVASEATGADIEMVREQAAKIINCLGDQSGDRASAV
jgi:hypothetical protein